MIRFEVTAVTDGEDIPKARLLLVVTDGEERNPDAILASIIVAKNNLILIKVVCAQVLPQIYLTVDRGILSNRSDIMGRKL